MEIESTLNVTKQYYLTLVLFCRMLSIYGSGKINYTTVLSKTSLTEMPFGQMPILKIDDVTLSQSVAIDFYLAKTFGM